jgi:hypothetical protein
LAIGALHFCPAQRRAHDATPQFQRLPILIHDATARRDGTTSLPRTHNKPASVRSTDPAGVLAPNVRVIAAISPYCDFDIDMLLGIERTIISRRCCIMMHFLGG